MHCTRAPRHLRALALALFTLVLEDMERAVPALLLLPSLETQMTLLVAWRLRGAKLEVRTRLRSMVACVLYAPSRWRTAGNDLSGRGVGS